METLKTPIEITKAVADALEKQKKTLGFAARLGWMVIIHDFNVEEKTTTHKRWSLLGHKETTDTSYYLTAAKIHVWQINRQTWMTLSEHGLNTLLIEDDITIIRRNYLEMIKAPLQFLGVQFKDKLLNE